MSDPAPLPQWDVPQEFAEAGSHAIRGELEEYIRVGDLLALLQSRARLSLNKAGDHS